MGADCAHHISTCPTHPDFQTFLRPCYGAVKQTWKCKTNYGYLIIHGHRSLFAFFEDDSTADIHTRPSAYSPVLKCFWAVENLWFSDPALKQFLIFYNKKVKSLLCKSIGWKILTFKKKTFLRMSKTLIFQQIKKCVLTKSKRIQLWCLLML